MKKAYTNKQLIPEIKRLQSLSRRRFTCEKSVWKLNQKATRKAISMQELKKAIEGERKAQFEFNGMSSESFHASEMLEMLWLIVNGYEQSVSSYERS